MTKSYHILDFLFPLQVAVFFPVFCQKKLTKCVCFLRACQRLPVPARVLNVNDVGDEKIIFSKHDAMVDVRSSALGTENESDL